MNKTLRISFSLKNTYRVNSILFGIKQIPLLGKLIPNTLYQVRELKIFANVLSVFWEIGMAFLGKFLYFLFIIVSAMKLYLEMDTGRLFLHIFFFLTIIGSFVNTYMFNPTRDKYYALILLGMNAREYTLINYFYEILKVLAGFALFGVLIGRYIGLFMWQCILIPIFVVGIKLGVSAYSLWDYERSGRAPNENKLGKFLWITMLALLAAAYGLPAIGWMLPERIFAISAVACGILGILSLRRIREFQHYREIYQELLADVVTQMDRVETAGRIQSNKFITGDASITSRREGFEYLNELFVQRHQKILWKSSKRIAAVCVALILGALLLFYLKSDEKTAVNEMLMTYLPYFVFIMYAVNRGTGFTRALFMNCDHSLLTYSFYKKRRFILRLFWIRLRELIKINLLPAAVIGAGMMILLYASGGTEQPLNYLVLLVSILCLSIFFSVHYLTIYYLLQPYNAGTEMQSGTYQLVSSATYFVCLFLMGTKMDTLVFGMLTIAFCVLYCLVASILVYRLAPRTFRLRN